MISVIVPVYNVEPYLRKCLDSIVNQTYKDLEILVIDDGSTDGCGKICDEYGEKDKRIRVFHTENRGLSAARNLGLDEAKGDWIGFVDSDDWIDEDMYEALYDRALETGADVVECGYYSEYQNSTVENIKEDVVFTGENAVLMLLQGKLSNTVWSKLWRNVCFKNLRFPVGRLFEEYAITYRLLYDAEKVCAIHSSKYHYFQRSDSISRIHSMKNLTDLWLSNKERYDFLIGVVDKAYDQDLLKTCAFSIARTWSYYYGCSLEEKKKYNCIVRQMNDFSREHFPKVGCDFWDIKLRIIIFFTHYKNDSSFLIAWILNKMHKKISNTHLII
ncbi:glycosyltransferase family 2 protein [Oribacterium sp. WCC10]|uniref:glycosyltransferase family 2 protein n=1 Tax=Oribacterium sp. WCC10 TaxID=1855343 RepID=UPI0008F44BD9|nr:glycosyltransferase family 2 protein [Oribacterium sp. WCC10]SFG65331.1 Glycosyltransferase involved in cell wall bisynthesis [Oribacterium sp. WCC10]